MNAVLEKFHAVGADHLTSLPQNMLKAPHSLKIAHVRRVVTQL